MTFQQYCYLCHQWAPYRLCRGCRQAIEALAIGSHQCRQCALPLSPGTPYCGRCLSRAPAFQRALIPYRYQFPLDYLIGQFKFHGCPIAARILSQLLGEWLDQQAPRPVPDIIVPAPLHWRRLLQRGFNQAQLLGQAASRATDVPVTPKRLSKHRHTASQRGLTRRERQDNIRASYSARNVRDLSVALVDDVVTTATTAREISRCLKRAGARSVEVWALARTPDEFD